MNFQFLRFPTFRVRLSVSKLWILLSPLRVDRYQTDLKSELKLTCRVIVWRAVSSETQLSLRRS
jgi:hypothetical protein